MDRSDRFLASLTDDGRYRLLIEAVTDYAIYLLGPSGIVTTWNSGAQRFKGYASDEIIGQHFSRFYSKEDLESPPLRWRSPHVKGNSKPKAGASAKTEHAFGPMSSSIRSAIRLDTSSDLLRSRVT